MPLMIKLPDSSQHVKKIVLLFFCILGLTIAVGLPGIAQTAISRATLTQVLDSPQVYIQNRRAKVNDAATRGQRVRTEAARAQLRFNTGAIGRMARNSVLTVGQQCARLQQGTVLVNGAANGCATSVVAGVRGTTYVIEVSEGNSTQITVLEGEVTIAKSPDSNSVETTPKVKQTQTPPTSVLRAGDRVVVRADGMVEPAQTISREEYDRLLTGELFEGYTDQLPGMPKIKQSYRALYPDQSFPTIQSAPVPGLW